MLKDRGRRPAKACLLVALLVCVGRGCAEDCPGDPPTCLDGVFQLPVRGETSWWELPERTWGMTWTLCVDRVADACPTPEQVAEEDAEGASAFLEEATGLPSRVQGFDGRVLAQIDEVECGPVISPGRCCYAARVDMYIDPYDDTGSY